MDNDDLIDLNEEIELQDDNSQVLDIIMEIMSEIGDGNYLGMDEFIEIVA